MVHRAARALEAHPGVEVVDPQGVLAALRQAVAQVLALHDAADRAARGKIESLSRRVRPGTREYSDLYARYLTEERRRRGL
ncbi:MAG: hypothetical protein Kow0092_19680 [Deferrisomatales bacterium]